MDIDVFLYSLMGALYSMNVPLVFKGAMVLKAIQMQTGNRSGLVRATKDVDGDWYSGTPTMDYILHILEQAVSLAGYANNIQVVKKREYAVGQTACFTFVNKVTGKAFSSIDINVVSRGNVQSTATFYTVNNISFIGQIAEKSIYDKVLVLSQQKIRRRIKDMIDLYIYSYCWVGSINNIYIMATNTLLDFDCFLNSKPELQHAYSKYKNTASVLPFDIIYNRVHLFVLPFILRKKDVFWTGEVWTL